MFNGCGLVVLALVAIVRAPVDESEYKRRSYDVAIVIDLNPLGADDVDWYQEVHSYSRAGVIDRIGNGLSGMAEFDLTIAVVNFYGQNVTVLQSFLPKETAISEPAFQAMQKREVVLKYRSEMDSAVEYVKQELEKESKNREDDPDVFIWVLIAKAPQGNQPTTKQMLEKLFQTANDKVEMFVAVEWTPADTEAGKAVRESYTAELLALTANGSAQITMLLETGRWESVMEDKVRTLMEELFNSCQVDSVSSGCFYEAGNRCVETVTVKPVNKLKFCKFEDPKDFELPCSKGGDTCEKECDALFQQGRVLITKCNASKCGETGIEVYRAKGAESNTRFANCPEISFECSKPKCPGQTTPAVVKTRKFHGTHTFSERRTKAIPTTETTTTELAAGTVAPLETWHIVVISLGGAALLAVFAIIIVCIAVSAKKRRFRSRHQSPHRQHGRDHRGHSPRPSGTPDRRGQSTMSTFDSRRR